LSLLFINSDRKHGRVLRIIKGIYKDVIENERKEKDKKKRK
jgi:hypothetical protein